MSEITRSRECVNPPLTGFLDGIVMHEGVLYILTPDVSGAYPPAMKKIIVNAALILCVLKASVCFAQNPLNEGNNIRTADPSGHVWDDGKMYLYTSHDEECQPDFFMKNWHTFSSSDLVTWVDHGPSLSVDDLSWADNYAWAHDAAYKSNMK
jgi:hypothetical protein